MGLLSNVINKVGSSKVGKAVFKPGGVVDTITKPIQYVGAIVANPVTTVTKGVGAALEKAKTESFEKQAGKVLLNTGTVAAAVVTGGTSVGRTAAANVAKSLVPKTLTGKLAGAAGVVVATGALTKTDKPIEAVSKAPGALFNFGQNAGSLIEDPSLAAAEKLLKENPLISTIAVGGAIAAGAGSIVTGIGALENIKTRESVQDLTKQLSIQPTPNTQLPTDSGIRLIDESKPLPANPNVPATPITPQTGNLTTTKPRKVSKYKKKKSALPTSINQKVNVIVQNRNTSVGIRQSKNYLNKRLLA